MQQVPRTKLNKLFFLNTTKGTDYYGRSGEVMFKGIMLPANALPKYADRQTVRNAAEEAEKITEYSVSMEDHLDAPSGSLKKQDPQMLREYCQEHFIPKGTIVNTAIRDKDGNQHIHLMLTMIAIDENGKFLPKIKKSACLMRTASASGCRTATADTKIVGTVDWNRREKCKKWRYGWKVVQNKHLETNKGKERVDLRSYECQGKEQRTTVHLEPGQPIWRRKAETYLSDFNRDIKETNRIMGSTRRELLDISE